MLDGEIVPASEKLVSLSELHADIIVKGGRQVQYGHKLNLATGKSGLILDIVFETGNPADALANSTLKPSDITFVAVSHTHADHVGNVDLFPDSTLLIQKAEVDWAFARAPQWGDALMVALAGAGNGIAQFWWTRSLSLASPSRWCRSATCRWYGQRTVYAGTMLVQGGTKALVNIYRSWVGELEDRKPTIGAQLPIRLFPQNPSQPPRRDYARYGAGTAPGIGGVRSRATGCTPEATTIAEQTSRPGVGTSPPHRGRGSSRPAG